MAEARAALFGEKRARGRTDAFDDLALFKILDANRKGELDGLRRAIAQRGGKPITPEWEAEIARDPKPIRTGAREFQNLAGSAASKDGLEDRLRRKARKPLSNREMAQIEALLDPKLSSLSKCSRSGDCEGSLSGHSESKGKLWSTRASISFFAGFRTVLLSFLIRSSGLCKAGPLPIFSGDDIAATQYAWAISLNSFAKPS
ncbi:hypothetical protein [Phaeobacter gallaeciensis]|uniref:hypothetical protein n=1 Tax=Phaeobacter gallaeciensis TaxID=60890 RepID=UPI0015F054F6|nr:hypothetical protein [Phaeobacter gallaeciensis]